MAAAAMPIKLRSSRRRIFLAPKLATTIVATVASAQEGGMQGQMSALGQKQTYAVRNAMPALPPIADLCGALDHVCFGPTADIVDFIGSPRRRERSTQEAL
jgi:hypothetical protein